MARKPKAIAAAQPAEVAGPPGIDARRLLADIRAGDPAAIERAFRQTFDTEAGRLVLAIHLSDCGVGGQFGPGLSDADLRYAVGRHDGAVALAAKAGFDQAALVTEIFTDHLEERTNDVFATHEGRVDEFGGGYTPADDDF